MSVCLSAPPARRPIFPPASLLVMLALALATPAGGQDSALDRSPTGGTVPMPAPADVETIDGILGALYDVISGPAGQPRNWDRFRSLHLPEARLIPTGVAGNGVHVRARVWTVDQYIEAARPALEGSGFFEREVGRVVERFENIAHVFSTYTSQRTPDGEVFQRGINSIQLVWDGTRWWIVTIFWRGVGVDEPIPTRYLRPGN